MRNARSWLLSILALAFVLLAFPCQDDEFKLFHTEQIGPLKIGLTEAQVREKMGSDAQLGKVEKWEADGLYHQKWAWNAQGVEISMASENPKGPKTVESVTVSAPCAFETRRGIRVGSPEGDVLKAYKADLDKEMSKPGQSIVAGSVYGGLIFAIKSGKVQSIFLGAAAE